MRAAGEWNRRYENEVTVWVEPQNMPQALYYTIAGVFINGGIDDNGTKNKTRCAGKL